MGNGIYAAAGHPSPRQTWESESQRAPRRIINENPAIIRINSSDKPNCKMELFWQRVESARSVQV